MPLNPLILAFDTSAAHCAVALVSGQTIMASYTETMSKGQAERLFPILEAVLAQAGKSWQDLDAIGCGIGPGNFTGIRLSVSAARGLALSLGIPAIGVDALEAMLLGAPEPALAMIDARRDQVYAKFSNTAPEVTSQAQLNFTDFGPSLTCFGHKARNVAFELGAKYSEPVHPMAVAIAKIALSRLDLPNPRPAPLYLKSADAAPSRDTAPAILL